MRDAHRARSPPSGRGRGPPRGRRGRGRTSSWQTAASYVRVPGWKLTRIEERARGSRARGPPSESCITCLAQPRRRALRLDVATMPPLRSRAGAPGTRAGGRWAPRGRQWVLPRGAMSRAGGRVTGVSLDGWRRPFDKSFQAAVLWPRQRAGGMQGRPERSRQT